MKREMRRKGPRTLTAHLGRFVLVFVVSLAVLAALWTVIAPTYTRLVGALSRPLFRLVESPNATVLSTQGAETWIYRIVGAHEIAPFTWFDRYTFFALIPLLALVAATPGLGWRRRIVRGMTGIGALLVVHVLYVVSSVELSYAAMGLRTVGPLAARTLDIWQIVVRVLWEAAPIVIWVALTFGAWRRLFARLRSGDSAGADARRSSWTGALGTLGWKKKEGTP